jgi:Mn2+/Fe2+ NRAMP family transporter
VDERRAIVPVVAGTDLYTDVNVRLIHMAGEQDHAGDEPGWSLIGPGLLVAATGVGAGDLVAALVAGSLYGLNFVWAIVLGVAIKFSINEGVGRYHLASGRTILEGFHSLGRWASGFFGGYTLLWGFVFGGAVAASCSLAATAIYPAVPFWAYVVVHPLVGAFLVLLNQYETFENLMTLFIGVMFVTVVGSAVLVLPRLGDIVSTGVPGLPDGSIIYVLGLIGGAGGTITMASYGYWLAEKEWDDRRYVSVMRLDASSAYVITGVFSIALMVMSAALLFGTGGSISGQQGLVTLANNLGNELHPALRLTFLIGFWCASFTSLLGVWHGVSYLFADFVATLSTGSPDAETLRDTTAYRFYVLWLTFPPMVLYFFGRPVFLIILYGLLGAVFMPFLAVVLLRLLNSEQVDATGRNHWLSNGMLLVSTVVFAALLLIEFVGFVT